MIKDLDTYKELDQWLEDNHQEYGKAQSFIYEYEWTCKQLESLSDKFNAMFNLSDVDGFNESFIGDE